MRNSLQASNRIVIKVGTSTLTYENGKINLTRMDKLAQVLCDLINQGKEVVLVSSGAIGVGIGKLKLAGRPTTVREKQAIAAVGQCELMHLYSKLFGEYGHIVGQILLTRDVIEESHTRFNVINTFECLLEKGILPIVNENDSVATDEIECGENRIFGDNDTLSAIVAKLLHADLLIILSDIDGFYDADPRLEPQAKRIEEVVEITDEIEAKAGGVGSTRGTGGMITKLHAAKIANLVGVPMVLATGKDPRIIHDILAGENVGTLFLAKEESR